MDQLDSYLQKASKSIFRYEALQDYSAEDGEESVKEFMRNGTLPFLPEETEWWRTIKTKNDQGIKTCRVRLVTVPLTDYTKMEIALHRKSAAYSGEDIRIIEGDQIRKVSKMNLPDYYLVDGKYLFLMEYGPKGKYLGSQLADEEMCRKFLGYNKKLINNSISITSFLKPK